MRLINHVIFLLCSVLGVQSFFVSSSLNLFKRLDKKIAVNRLDATSSRLANNFQKDKAELVTYITAGYPNAQETVDLLLAMEAGGATILELGVPFTDPQADGATIQKANEVALSQKVNLKSCLSMVNQAREKGLKAPVVLMGYYNPFFIYGLDTLMKEAKQSGVDGFIVVDLPPEEGAGFVKKANEHGLSYIPLVSPTSTDDRIQLLDQSASSFMYCVSIAGVTGARTSLPSDLKDFIHRIRANSHSPLAVGFGISTPEQVAEVSRSADGVVIGSAIINTIDGASHATPAERSEKLKNFVHSLSSAIVPKKIEKVPTTTSSVKSSETSTTNFGDYGGRYIPETLIEAHRELENAYAEALKDPKFHEDIAFYRREFTGGPTPVYFAENLTKKLGGARIWIKREDLCHTGAHKVNNAVGQALLAKRLGKHRIIAETGAGQHGVATAAVCAHFGLDCTVYMGAVDCERQKLNVFRMNVLGAKVVPVEQGSKTLKDAINEAMRDWVTNVRTTHYLIGSAIGPHPFPTIVRDFQSVIGTEARKQMLERAGKLPDVVVACVGGGSNAIGMFYPFKDDASVRLVGAEAGGEGPEGLSSATLSFGQPGVLHGTKTYLLQDSDGQVAKTKSISAGLDYPGVGPEHAYFKDIGRAEYVPVTDKQAMEAFFEFSKAEGIIPALEPSHALYEGMKIAATLSKDQDVLINLSGRGDKDMITVAKYMGVQVI